MITVEVPAAAVVAGAGVVALLVLAAVVAAARGRRRIRRRLEALAQRLPGDVSGSGTEDLLLHLERSIDDARFEASTAASTAGRLRAAVEAMDVGVVLCDEHGESLFANRAASARLRRSELIESAYRAVLDAALAGRAEDRDVDDPGPPPASFRLSGVPLDDEVRSLGAAVVVEDLTVRRHADAGHRQLLTDLVRELGQPVAGLTTLAEAAADEADAEVRRRLVERTRSQAVRARAVLDDVMELTRLAAADRAIPERLVVVDALCVAVERASGLATAGGVSLGPVPIHQRSEVDGDRAAIVTAITKLVERAVSEAPRGATVTLGIRAGGGLVGVEVGAPAPEARSSVTAAVLEQLVHRIGADLTEVRGDDGVRTTSLQLPGASPG